MFLIQPMLAKSLLPRFGGAAGVWTTSMLFFQVALLAGYLYAHGLTRLPRRAQALVHGLLLAASVGLLPVQISLPGDPGHPVTSILGHLVVAVGLPYLLLASTSPLLQSWLASEGAGAGVYRLYSLSNTASLLALLGYPILVEPLSRLGAQLRGWSAGYAAFALLAGWLALRARRLAEPPREPLRRWPGVWLTGLLAALPSALWLAVANQMSQTLTPVPLLWVVPLSVYLVSLVVAFHREGWYRPAGHRVLLPAGVLLIGFALQQYGWSRSFAGGSLAYTGGLFLCCWFCHAEMVRRKPPTGQLTGFYLVVATGGAAGAGFAGLVAPALLHDYLELPLALIGCLLLAAALLFGYSSPRRVLRLTLVAAVTLAVLVSVQSRHRTRQRNFYGVVETADHGEGATRYRILFHGSILHGVQFLSPGHSGLATAYYGPRSGVAVELRNLAAPRRRVGVIGLGVGTLAAYARPGDVFRFYEINPRVAEWARTRFRYLAESQGHVEVVVADARVALAAEPAQQFDLLAVDAFAGDAVPAHLLTREAFALYLSHLKPEGILAVHVSSKYVDLTRLIHRQAAALGRQAITVTSPPDPPRLVNAATWIVWKRARAPDPGAGGWTDDYVNLLDILK